MDREQQPPFFRFNKIHQENLEDNKLNGRMAERFIAPVLKTGKAKVFLSSNLNPAAMQEKSCI